MAAAIPAAIGLGSSVIGGIQGKGAAKKQAKLQEQQYALLKPLLEAQAAGGRYALDQSKPLIEGASQGFSDLRNFWQPLVSGDRSAIDMFLSPERRAINQGYRSAANNLATFGPRGGGRVSALAAADEQRQGRLSDLVFGARREGANQLGNITNAQAGFGSGLLGAGMGAGQQLSGLYNNQANRAFQQNQITGNDMAGMGEALGKFLGNFKTFGGSGFGKS